MSIIEFCPACGKSLDGNPTKATGHLRKGDERIIFAACSEHFDEAERSVTVDSRRRSLGYMGEWKPEYGQVEFAVGEDAPA